MEGGRHGIFIFNFRQDYAGKLFRQGQVHHGSGVHHELHRDAFYHGHPPAGRVRGDGMGRPLKNRAVTKRRSMGQVY